MDIIVIWNIDINGITYTRKVYVHATVDWDFDSKIAIAYHIEHATWEITSALRKKPFVLWSYDIGESYDSLKTILDEQWQTAFASHMVAAADILNLFD